MEQIRLPMCKSGFCLMNFLRFLTFSVPVSFEEPKFLQLKSGH